MSRGPKPEKPSPGAVIRLCEGEPKVLFARSLLPDSYYTFANSRYGRMLREERAAPPAAPRPERPYVRSLRDTLRHRHLDYNMVDGKPVDHRCKPVDHDVQKWSVTKAGRFSFGRADTGEYTLVKEVVDGREYITLEHAGPDEVREAMKARSVRCFGHVEGDPECEAVPLAQVRQHLADPFLDLLEDRYTL